MSILSIIARTLRRQTPAILVRQHATPTAHTVDRLPMKRVDATPGIFGTEIDSVSSAITQRVPVTLIHGRAGTGKTTLIRKFVDQSCLNHIVVAPTGVAALNAGGQTIHSFFGLQWGIINLDEIKLKDRLRTILRRLDFIVIDEISMVRADLLDSVDYSLRIHRNDDSPFGGVPMLLVGDFLQLPPIVKRSEIPILRNLGYQSRFAFAAKCVQDIVPNVIELTTVHRQTEVEFIELLGKLRLGEDVDNTVATLNRLCYRPHRPEHSPVLLTARIATAELHNMRGIRSLPGGITTYTGKIVGQFPKDERLPAPEFLDLKIGARVMLVKNDTQKRWVNGSLATVTKLQPRSVWVRLDEDSFEHEITIETWENIKQEWNRTESRIMKNVIGTYSQIPLIQAWAITIHKAQGLTLSDVRIDLGSGAFSEGQTYVALSRAKSIEGLSLAIPLTAGDVRVNSHLVDGVERMAKRVQ